MLARGHQQLIWARQRQANIVRSALGAFYPAALVGVARSEARAAAIRAVLVGQQLEAPPVVAAAYGQVVAAAVAVIASLSEQLAGLEAALTAAFTAHPDAGIVRSQPGLGVVLAARVLAEFGDDPNRYANAKARKAYAGTAPITRASGPATGGAGPSGREPAAEHRLPPVGVRGADRLAGCPPLLRRPPGSWRHPPSGAPGPRESAGRDPARLPAPPPGLRRAAGRADAHCRGRLNRVGWGCRGRGVPSPGVLANWTGRAMVVQMGPDAAP